MLNEASYPKTNLQFICANGGGLCEKSLDVYASGWCPFGVVTLLSMLNYGFNVSVKILFIT